MIEHDDDDRARAEQVEREAEIARCDAARSELPLATRERVAEWCNMIGRTSRRGGAPALDAGSSRARLLAWLQWNDGNGCYLDALGAIEGFDPIELDAAWEILREHAEGNDWR